jgi:hypothetical protein
MKEYIARVKKLGPQDIVNGNTFNNVIQQLQHNIDLVYGSVASAEKEWNTSEVVFGNVLDYDATGQKRYINGGNLDSLEKVLPWASNIGDVSFSQIDFLENDKWLRYTIEDGIKSNIVLKRSMTIPDALAHQNIIVAFKFVPVIDLVPVQGERFDIYINGVYSGTGEAGTHTIDGKEVPKTIYGTYSLTGDESNLEVSLVRSPTLNPTPVDYSLFVQSAFVGLHTLGNSSYSLNFPVSGSAFIGAGADINSFYDFENNAIRPIPSFLLNEERLEGSGSLTINITSQAPEIRDTYYLGVNGTGNQLGTSVDNKMSAADFILINAFPSSLVDVFLEQEDDYENLVFDNGNFLVHFDGDTSADKVTVDNGATVRLNADNISELDITDIEILGKSNLEINLSGGNLTANNIYGTEHSYVQANIGTLSMPLLSGGLIELEDSAKFDMSFVDISKVNGDGSNGFGASLGNIKLDKYSFLDIQSVNSNLNIHIGRGTEQSESVFINSHCHLSIEGFNLMSTGSTERKFVGKLHSSIEIETPIQSDGGATAFTDIELALFSTFGSTISGGTLNEDLIESFIYEI